MIGLYLLAIVLANVSVMIFGPDVSILNAFLFIGFNLTSRDKLHERWEGKNLKTKMFLLILSGSVLSAIFGAGRIAIASFVAFAFSESIDAVVYHYTRNINKSNFVSAMVDSILFPMIAFGFPLLTHIVVGQFLAKVIGGYVWLLVIKRWTR